MQTIITSTLYTFGPNVNIFYLHSQQKLTMFYTEITVKVMGEGGRNRMVEPSF